VVFVTRTRFRLVFDDNVVSGSLLKGDLRFLLFAAEAACKLLETVRVDERVTGIMLFLIQTSIKPE